MRGATGPIHRAAADRDRADEPTRNVGVRGSDHRRGEAHRGRSRGSRACTDRYRRGGIRQDQCSTAELHCTESAREA